MRSSSKVKASELVILDKAEVGEAKTKALKLAFVKLGLDNALIIDGAELNKGFAAGGPQHPEYRRAAPSRASTSTTCCATRSSC
jgi:ribosomal protein L4